MGAALRPGETASCARLPESTAATLCLVFVCVRSPDVCPECELIIWSHYHSRHTHRSIQHTLQLHRNDTLNLSGTACVVVAQMVISVLSLCVGLSDAGVAQPCPRWSGGLYVERPERPAPPPAAAPAVRRCRNSQLAESGYGNCFICV